MRTLWALAPAYNISVPVVVVVVVVPDYCTYNLISRQHSHNENNIYIYKHSMTPQHSYLFL